MKRLLLSAGLTALTFSSPQEFIEYAKAHRVPVLILDVNMPELSGPEVFAWLRSKSPDSRVIFISGTNDASCCAAVMAQGAAAFFAKPFIDDVFLACVHTELAKSEQK